MKIKPYVEKLEQSEEYKNFKIKYPDSFMMAGFFVLDLEGGVNVHQIDFYIPAEKKVALFTLDEGVKLDIKDMIRKDETKDPEKMDFETNIDLDALQGILMDEMKNRGISEDIKKIIAVIQNIDGKKIWNLNCVLTGMEILKSHVEDETKTVLKMDRTSVMDIMKHIPTGMMKAQEGEGDAKGDAKKEIEQLEKLESEIEEEKKKLKESIDKEKPKTEEKPKEEPEEKKEPDKE